MKTTIDLPDSLARQVRELAAAEGVTLRELMVEGLRHEIERRSAPLARPPFRFRTVKGDGLQVGVNPGSLVDLSYEPSE